MEQVFDEAVAAFDGNQAALARALGRSASVVSNWRIGRFKPDYESCLRLARITGRAPGPILAAAGHDASLLPTDGFLPPPQHWAELARYKRVIGQLTAVLESLVTDGDSNGNVIQANGPMYGLVRSAA